MDSRKREGQQLLLRFPDGSDLRKRLELCADANNRSLTGEIIHRLEMSMSAAAATLPADRSDDAPVGYAEFVRLAEKVRWLEERLSILEKG